MTNKLFIDKYIFVDNDTKINKDIKIKIDVFLKNSSIKSDKRKCFNDIIVFNIIVT